MKPDQLKEEIFAKFKNEFGNIDTETYINFKLFLGRAIDIFQSHLEQREKEIEKIFQEEWSNQLESSHKGEEVSFQFKLGYKVATKTLFDKLTAQTPSKDLGDTEEGGKE